MHKKDVAALCSEISASGYPRAALFVFWVPHTPRHLYGLAPWNATRLHHVRERQCPASAGIRVTVKSSDRYRATHVVDATAGSYASPSRTLREIGRNVLNGHAR